MTFSFPFGEQVVELASGHSSEVFAFSDSVPAEAGEIFVRIIALWHDNQALGPDPAPTIEIRSGQGSLTPLVVTQQVAATTKVTIIGTDGVQAANAACVHENNDIYLIHVFDLLEANGPWQLRIRNNDPETLHFVAVSSIHEAETRQPWMVWGATPNSFTTTGNPDDLTFGLQNLDSTHSVTVRNLGTGPLLFAERSGVSIGQPDSPLVIVKPAATEDTPLQINPHGVVDIVFGVHANGADRDTTITHAMNTNDRRHTANLTIFVARTNYPQPPPGSSCNLDHCPGFIPPPPYHSPEKRDGACIQPGCGHSSRVHGLGWPCNEHDGCPGFVNSGGYGLPTGTDSWDAVCVQSGCGHYDVSHQPKEHVKESKDYKDKDYKDKDHKEKEGKEKEHHGKELEFHAMPLFGAGEKMVADRLAGLERKVAELVHFIRPELRPDLAGSALQPDESFQEADLNAFLVRQEQEARMASEAKGIEKRRDR